MADSKAATASTNASAKTAPSWSVVTNLLSLSSAEVKSLTDGQVQHLDVSLKVVASDAIMGKMGQTYFDNLGKFSKLIAYDGFNPLTILKIMAEKAVAYNKSSPSEEIFDFNFEGVQFSLQKKANLNEDVAMLCTVFLTRGNNLFKILKTISKDSKVAISAKMVTYGIKSDDDSEAAARKRKEKVVLSSTDITLSRIASTFPQITLAVAKQHEIEGKASLMAIQECYKLTGGVTTVKIPHVLQHGMLASLLSRSSPDNEASLRDFCYMFNLEQSMTLQPYKAIGIKVICEVRSKYIDVI